MPGTISNIAQLIAQKTDSNAVQIEKEMERKILDAINTASDSKYTIGEIETMLTSPQAKKLILCLKKDIAKKGGAMSGGNGDSRAALANACAFAIIGIVALVIALSLGEGGDRLGDIVNIIAMSGGRKRKTRKRKTRKKRRKNLKQKRN